MLSNKSFMAGRFLAAFVFALLVSVFLLAVGVRSAYATTSAELQAEAQAAFECLQELNEQYNISAERYDQAVMEQQEAQARIDEATEEITELQGLLSNRMRTMYREGNYSFLDLVLGCATFEEFVTNWDILTQLNESDATLVSETKELRTEVQEQEKVLAEQAEIAKEEKESAEAMAKTMEETYENLSAEAAVLLAQEQQAAAEAAYAAAQATFTGDTSDWTGYTGTWEYEASDSDTSSSDGSTTTYSSDNDILSRAYEWLGSGSYVWGSCSPGEFDCSGFVSYCLTGEYSRIGTTTTFMEWDQTSDPQPGDVCVSEGHTGIYIGNGQMVHAASEDEGIVVGPVQDGMIYVHQ